MIVTSVLMIWQIKQKHEENLEKPKPGICYKTCVAHSEELPMPLFTTLPDIEEAQDMYLLDHTAMSSGESCSDYKEPSHGPQQCNQS